MSPCLRLLRHHKAHGTRKNRSSASSFSFFRLSHSRSFHRSFPLPAAWALGIESGTASGSGGARESVGATEVVGVGTGFARAPIALRGRGFDAGAAGDCTSLQHASLRGFSVGPFILSFRSCAMGLSSLSSSLGAIVLLMAQHALCYCRSLPL